MADIKFLQDIDFTGVTSKNFVVESKANTSVSSPITGQIIFDTASSVNKLAYYDGSKWVQVPSSTSNYTWTLQGDTNPSSAVVVNSANTVDIAGGTGISTALTTASGNLHTLTVNNDKPFDKIVVSDGSTSSDITNSGTITFAGGGGVTVGESSGTITITGPSGTMTSWTVDATNGSSQTVSNGETVIFQTTNGSTKASISGTRAISIDAEYGPTTSGKNLISVAPTTTATVDDDDQLLIETDTSTQADKHVNKISASLLKSYIVDGIATGMTFKGAYNASTAAGSPDLGSNDGSPGVALVLGDTYVVSAVGGTGQFYSQPIEVGDLIIVNTAHASGSQNVTASSFTIVNRNIDVATATTAGIASFPTADFSLTPAGAVSLNDQFQVSSTKIGSASQIPEITVNQHGIVTDLKGVNVTIPKAGKFMTTATSGNNTTSLTYKHDLGAKCIVQVYAMTGETGSKVPTNVVYADIQYVDDNNIKLNFASAKGDDDFGVAIEPVVV